MIERGAKEPAPLVRFARAALLMGVIMVRSSAAEIPGGVGAPAVKVIDVHAHIFNARDLPLRGVLEVLGAPESVAQVLAAVLNAETPEDDGKQPPASATAVEKPSFTLNDQQRAVLDGYVDRGDVEQMSRRGGVSPDTARVVAAVRKAGFPPEESTASSRGRLYTTDGAIQGDLRFIWIMLQRHPDIGRYASKRAFPAVDLFVHHMMDMEKPYDDSPANAFGVQIDRAQAIDDELGTFMHFVAFDPFRREHALELAQRGIQKGAIGIKFYPPSGYRASDNFFPRLPKGSSDGERSRWKSRYDGWKPDKLNTAIWDMFAWAAANDVPIFTHCTPKGFEAAKGYGLRADPYYWRKVLTAFPRLRVCFAHGGGDQYWFSDPHDDGHHTGVPPVDRGEEPPGDPWSFGRQVVDLAREFSNVYFEVGYLDDILHQGGDKRLIARLESLLSIKSADGSYQVGDRIMYGSDWHLISREEGYASYLEAFDRVMQNVDTGRWRQVFFAGNAITFLRLRDRRNEPIHAKQRAALDAVLQGAP